jgi:hypothetical protein
METVAQKIKNFEDEIFTVKARINECNNLKEQFQAFLEKQSQFEKMFVTDYKNSLIKQISSMKTEFIEVS